MVSDLDAVDEVLNDKEKVDKESPTRSLKKAIRRP
jgi:hypothetical protein